MGRVTKTILFCDVCQEEVKEENDLHSVSLPYKQSDCEGREFCNSYKCFDLCEKCKSNYENIVYKQFVKITDVLGRIDVEIPKVTK